MAGWQEEAVKDAVRSGDAGKAVDAYDKYRESMTAAGQAPKSPRDLGISK